jgi:hypothetical protein
LQWFQIPELLELFQRLSGTRYSEIVQDYSEIVRFCSVQVIPGLSRYTFSCSEIDFKIIQDYPICSVQGFQVIKFCSIPGYSRIVKILQCSGYSSYQVQCSIQGIQRLFRIVEICSIPGYSSYQILVFQLFRIQVGRIVRFCSDSVIPIVKILQCSKIISGLSDFAVFKLFRVFKLFKLSICSVPRIQVVKICGVQVIQGYSRIVRLSDFAIIQDSSCRNFAVFRVFQDCQFLQYSRYSRVFQRLFRDCQICSVQRLFQGIPG